MFNWEDARFFLELARARNLTRAAQKLGVNHTTVARRIQNLERRLKTRLFEQTPAGYALTASGEQLLRHADAMEASSIAAAEAVTGRDTVQTGTVRLGVLEGLGSQFIAPRLPMFYRLFPGINLEVVAGTQFLSISKREADLAITLSRPRVGRLIARKLTDYTLRLYGARSYLGRRPPIRQIDQVAAHPLIGYIDDLIYAPQLRYLDEILPDARVQLRSSSINAQFMAVKAGLGLGVLPCFMAVRDKSLQPVLPASIEVKRTFWISMHEDMRSIRRVAAVWDWLNQIALDERPALLGQNESVS